MALKDILSYHTRQAIKFDLLRLKARLKNRANNITSPYTKLHLGCGKRKIKNWLNVDVVNSDYDIDLAIGKLPWKENTFDTVVSQHVIEHLHLEHELIPLIQELARILKPGAEIWLSTPDMEKVCKAYETDKANGLIKDRQSRFPHFSMRGIPDQHFINILFQQGGQHKNLLDFELLPWLLESNGFADVKRVSEADLLRRFPELPERKDDFQSVYVKAICK